MCVWKGGFTPAPTRPRRYYNPELLVLLYKENLTAAASKESLTSRRDSQELEGDPIPVTVAIIKPDAVQVS